MNSNEYELRGRCIAHACWSELEKIAFGLSELQGASHEALGDVVHYAQGAKTNFGWKRFIPGSLTRGAHVAESGRNAALQEQARKILSARKADALRTMGRTDASAEELEKARETFARVGKIDLKPQPMNPSLADVKRSVSGGPSVADQASGRSTRKMLAAGATGAAVLGGGAYLYNKTTTPAAPDYNGSY